mgnify:CR=1 FL=1
MHTIMMLHRSSHLNNMDLLPEGQLLLTVTLILAKHLTHHDILLRKLSKFGFSLKLIIKLIRMSYMFYFTGIKFVCSSYSVGRVWPL